MVREGLRRTGYDEVALTSLSSADFSGIDGVVADLVNEQEGTGGVSLSLPSLRVDAFTVGIATEIQKVRRTGLTFAPEARLVAAAPGDQQADHRGRPLRRGRRRVLAGLAAGEALLPHRPADRDATTTRSASPSWRATSSRSAGSTPSTRACTVSVGGFVPKPHTPFQWFGQNGVEELHRKIDAAARRAARAAAAQLKWHDPEATFAEGIVSRGDRRIGRVIERVWRAGRHVPGVERALRARPLARRDGGRGPRPRLVRHPPPHPRRGAAVGPHRAPGCTPISSGPTGRRRSPSTASPIAGGLRATTAGCAPATPSSTSSRRRSRPRAAARAPARTCPRRCRDPGHAASGPNRPLAGGRCLMRGDAGFPVRVRYAKRGKVRWISHRDVARAFERALRIEQLPLAFTLGLLAPPEGELRARAVDRLRERRRVPRPRARGTDRSRAASRAAHCGAARSGSRSTPSSPSRSGRPRCRKSSPRSPGKSR